MAAQWERLQARLPDPVADDEKRRSRKTTVEFELRGWTPLWDLVKDDMERYLAYLRRGLEGMKLDDPEGWDRLELGDRPRNSRLQAGEERR